MEWKAVVHLNIIIVREHSSVMGCVFFFQPLNIIVDAWNNDNQFIVTVVLFLCRRSSTSACNFSSTSQISKTRQIKLVQERDLENLRGC